MMNRCRLNYPIKQFKSVQLFVLCYDATFTCYWLQMHIRNTIIISEFPAVVLFFCVQHHTRCEMTSAHLSSPQSQMRLQHNVDTVCPVDRQTVVFEPAHLRNAHGQIKSFHVKVHSTFLKHMEQVKEGKRTKVGLFIWILSVLFYTCSWDFSENTSILILGFFYY